MLENTTQTLGGTRQSSPLDDEMSYPLTGDEYSTIKENLLTDKFTNWEAFLITTGVTSLISGCLNLLTGSFTKHTVINGIDKIEINISEIITVIIYGAISFGSIVGFIIAVKTKKKSEGPMSRLDKKIMNHLSKVKS